MWAVIDIGSNTIRLVIYLVEDGRPRAMLNKKYPVGLAGYIDETNRIQPEGVQVLLEALTDVGTILKYIQPACVLPFGTAALRNSAFVPLCTFTQRAGAIRFTRRAGAAAGFGSKAGKRTVFARFQTTAAVQAAPEHKRGATCNQNSISSIFTPITTRTAA